MKCKLCLENEDIQKSHIIPNAFFKNVKDNTGKYNEVSKVGNKYVQVSYHEPLLYLSCEQKFSTEFETYVIDFVLKNPAKVGIKTKSTSKYITFSNVDFRKLKLFQMSILWRAAVSSLDFYKHVKLDLKAIELLREGLDSLTPLEADVLPCFMDRIFIDALNDKTTLDDRKNSKKVIFNPKKNIIKAFGVEYISFIFGGFEWRFWIHKCSEYYIKKHDVISHSRILNTPIQSIGTHKLSLEAVVLARGNELRGYDKALKRN
jgi:hypothetical protein